ncbi:hypothetical protein RN001_012306 [Aquatica leii]|uniref:Uncharacterized protein n=1 Tax=Aquatica leii TaxID=1421715 RepID=A0AAN7PSR0_9COLE|nr:hypothetical protein RN001_012306 [Aquatica leii]
MPASTILNRLACELFCDDKLVEIYENLCERLVLHDDVTEPEDEQISEQFIQRVSNIKKTNILVFLKMQPSTSKNSNLNTFVGGNITISNGFKYFNIICKDENPIKKFKILDKTMVFKFKEISESRNSLTWLENAFNEVIGENRQS